MCIRDSANRIVLADPVCHAFRKKRALPAIRPLNEALHLILPQIVRESYRQNHLKQDVFTQPGSFATELVKVDAGTCPLRSESDRNIAVPRMNAIAKSGPTTPASGGISCRGYQASDLP